MAYVKEEWDRLCAITSEICVEHRKDGDWIGRPAAFKIACEQHPELSSDPPGHVDGPGKKSDGAASSGDTTTGTALPWGEVRRAVGAETKSVAGENITPGQAQPWADVFHAMGVSTKDHTGNAR